MLSALTLGNTVFLWTVCCVFCLSQTHSLQLNLPSGRKSEPDHASISPLIASAHTLRIYLKGKGLVETFGLNARIIYSIIFGCSVQNGWSFEISRGAKKDVFIVTTAPYKHLLEPTTITHRIPIMIDHA